MRPSGDPFTAASGDPFAAQGGVPTDVGPPTTYGTLPPAQFNGDRNGGFPGMVPGDGPPPRAPLNIYAVLAAVFGVVVPPAGVALGHLALPQIKRIGQRGWLAAMCGLVVGYLMCAVLVVVLIALLADGDPGSDEGSATSSAAVAVPSPSVVTSIAPAPARPHTKLDLRQATVGTCVEVEKRDESSDEALDLYEVPCQHRFGVYTVVARVPTDTECDSTYIAAPPDRSFAVCLNRY